MVILWLFVQALNCRLDTKLHVRRFRDCYEKINYQVSGTMGSKLVQVTSKSWRLVVRALADMA